MGWLSETKLRELGIKFGKNVKVDSSCVIACNELEIGDNSRIDAFCFLSGKIKIGRHVHISVGATLAGSDGIEVGDFAGIGAHSYLFTASADFIKGSSLVNPTIPKEFVRKKTTGKIILEDHVSFGAFCAVFPNSILREGSMYGMYSLIKGEYEEWKLYTSTIKKATYRLERPKETILSDAKKVLELLD